MLVEQANDCVVLLAGLALAEGDWEASTELILSTGTGSGWACIVADALARRFLGSPKRRLRVTELHPASRVEVRASPSSRSDSSPPSGGPTNGVQHQARR